MTGCSSPPLHHRQLWRRALACLFLCWLGSHCYAEPALGLPQEVPISADFSLLINNETLDRELSLASLRSIFSMRKRSWDNNQPVTVVVLPSRSKTHQRFCKKVLKIYPFVLQEQWDRQIFSGGGLTPVIAKNEQELMEIIRNNPGSIGYRLRDPQSRLKNTAYSPAQGIWQ